ncbi:MAG: WG repeat-containing protein [Eubacteriales bacterium]|nr:WG repeat-containing protein [Eubacteriales bacterium]
MKKLVIAAVFFLLSAAWWIAFTAAVEKPGEYKQCLEQAKKYEEKEIYYDAILAYKRALEYKPENMGIYLKIAGAYRKLGDGSGFENVCNQAINLGGDNEEAILTLTDYYLETGRTDEAVSLLRRHIEEKKENGALRAKLQTLAGGYHKTGGEYDAVSAACGHYMFVKKGEDFGMIDENGSVVIRAQYEELGLFGANGFAPVKKDGQWYYIDTNNYKRRVPDEEYEFLGIVNQDVIPARKNGKWGYLNEDFKEMSKFVFDGATPILNNIGAVKKDGKWALVNEKLEPFTDFGFDEVVTDEWGFCSRNGVVFVKTGESYYLINSDGVEVGETYEKVSPFVSEKPAAVMQAGKWGFVSSKGEKALECMFDGAKSFSGIGYAPVKSGDRWGYIKGNGDFVIEPVFDGAKAFNSKGIAPVKNKDVWQLIQLDIY